MFEEFNYNKDWEKRDKLIFGEANIEKYKWGGIYHFEKMDVDTLKALLDEKFADPEGQQNCAPCIKDIYDFMVDHPNFVAHGYAVSPERDDYRVSIEGVDGTYVEKDMETIKDFTDLFRYADEFSLDDLWCWFD